MTLVDTPARLAATVILARDGEPGLEVFLVRRHERSHAFSNAHVFPGGTVRPDDFAGPGVSASAVEALQGRADSRPDGDRAAALYRCAMRELFEEAGVLLTHVDSALHAGDAGFPDAPEQDLDELRRSLQQGALTLDNVLVRLKTRPAFEHLVAFSQWVTPVALPARYDTWFFVAEMPSDQEALHCDVETTDGEWANPAVALEGATQGRFSVVYPTAMHLRRIAGCRTVAELRALAESKAIRRVQPVWRGVGERGHPELVDVGPEDW